MRLKDIECHSLGQSGSGDQPSLGIQNVGWGKLSLGETVSRLYTSSAPCHNEAHEGAVRVRVGEQALAIKMMLLGSHS